MKTVCLCFSAFQLSLFCLCAHCVELMSRVRSSTVPKGKDLMRPKNTLAYLTQQRNKLCIPLVVIHGTEACLVSWECALYCCLTNIHLSINSVDHTFTIGSTS